ncbi:SxtJ family membrane protein [Verrucomicrobia bacterium]|jgi:carbamoyltransferase|nr:SxtJ family membrane protein [Verrucomicrobiota bacterium]MDG1890729.1 SxtJ family membrane protein [Verrucomicrobiota bacterium]
MALMEIDWKPGARQLRQFAALSLLFFGGGGTWLFYGIEWTALACSPFWAVAVIFGALGLIQPRVAWPLYVVLMAVALPIGMVVSFLMLAAIYFGVITPIGLGLRLCGKDPMTRKLNRQFDSYWIPRKAPDNSEQYFRQY